MNNHIFPVIGHLPVTELKVQHFINLLKRIDDYQQGRELTPLAVMLTLHVFIRSSELRFARAGRRLISETGSGLSPPHEKLSPMSATPGAGSLQYPIAGFYGLAGKSVAFIVLAFLSLRLSERLKKPEVTLASC